MENEYYKHHEVFQRFFAENFERVRGYLIHGIFDHRKYFWQAFQAFIEKPDSQRTTVPLNDIGIIYEYWKSDGKFHNYNGSEVPCKAGMVFSEDRTSDENLKIKVRNSGGTLTDLQLRYVSDFTKQSTTYKQFNFEIEGVEGEGFVIVGPIEIYQGKKIRKVYCSDIFTEFEENSPDSYESVFDAFFGFFSAALQASKQDKTQGAYFNLEQTLKCIIGEPVSPLRYLVAFADQYMRYLFNFYGLFKGVSKDKTLDDLIYLLSKKISKGNGIHQIFYLRKFLRNVAAHEDQPIVKYRENIRLFILDFICMTYIIQHKVNGGCNPVWRDSTHLEAIKTFFTHVATHNIKMDVDNESLDEAGACFIKPFKKYMASVEFNGSTVTNEIEIGKELLEHTNIELTLTDDKINIGSNKKLEEVNNFDFGPLVNSLVASDREMARSIDSLNEKFDSLAIQDHEKDDIWVIQDSLEKLQKNFESTIAELSLKDDVSKEDKDALEKIKKLMDEDKPRLEEYLRSLGVEIGVIDERSKKNLVLICMIIAGFVAVAFGYYAIHVPKLAIEYDWIYSVSQSIGIKALTSDFPYERALHLEIQIRENQVKDWQSGNRAKHELINLQMVRKNNALRAKAAECYRKAIEIYKSKVTEDSNRSADLAARLAHMYSLGKGGETSFDQALKYAQIAANADMEKYTGRYIYHQLSQGSMSEIKKTMANRLDYLSETDPFYPLIKAKIDMNDALSLPPAQQDSVIQHAIADVKSVAISSSPAALFAIEQLTIWCLEGITDASDNYIIDKDPFVGIEYLGQAALEFNSMNSQTMLADILCNFTFRAASLDLYAAAFYNGDINSGYRAHDVATRLLGKSEEEIEKQWPSLHSVKKSRNNMEKMMQAMRNFTDGNYEYALINLEGLKEDLPDNLILIGVEDAIRKCKVHIPDSVKAIKEEFAALPINSSLLFRQNTDSLIKREAISDYFDAYLASLQDANESQALIDSLLNEAWTKGFVDAGVLLADRIYNNDQYHSHADVAFKIMKEASPYSDEANLWLADKYYISEISESRKYLNKVKDSNNFYKLIRQYDELELDHYNNVHPYTEKEISLMRHILNSLDLNSSTHRDQDLATNLIYCAAISRDDLSSQSAFSLCLSAAHGINRSSCAIFYPIYIQEHLQPNYRTKLEELYNRFAEDFAFPVPVGLSPVNINYLQLRIRETSRGNEFYTDLRNPYPSFLSRDLHPEPIEFKDPWSLYSDK